MARLIDWIRAKGLNVPTMFAEHCPIDREGFFKTLFGAEVIVADNVVGHYFEAEDRGMDHMPSLMPPFPTTWIEARFGGTQFGILYIGASTSLLKTVKTTASTAAIAMLFSLRDHKPHGPILQIDVPLDDRGYFMTGESDRLARSNVAAHEVDITGAYGMKSSSQKDYSVLMTVWSGHEEDIPTGFEAIKALLFAVGMMNCSNVGTVEVEPSPKLSKKRQKRYGSPLVRYRVIQVRPHLTAKGGKHSTAQAVSEDTPLHVCRGHFKTYEEDAPLLGKHTGTFWWKAQMRGSKEHGEIIHEYEVE